MFGIYALNRVDAVSINAYDARMNATAHIRSKLGANQTDFAAMAGVRQSTVSRWERGEGEPSISELRRILAASKGRLTPDDILGGDAS